MSELDHKSAPECPPIVGGVYRGKTGGMRMVIEVKPEAPSYWVRWAPIRNGGEVTPRNLPCHGCTWERWVTERVR